MQKTKRGFTSMKMAGTAFALLAMMAIAMWMDMFGEDKPPAEEQCDDKHLVRILVETHGQPTEITWVMGREDGDLVTADPQWSREQEISCGQIAMVRAVGGGDPVCVLTDGGWEIVRQRATADTCAFVRTIA